MSRFFLLSLLSVSMLLGSQDDLAIDEAFLQTLNEVSEIVMHDKLNIEKIPSTVTVIRRDMIEASGAKTLLDILALVPGIEISMTSGGKRQIIIRGMRNKYKDKLKLLINGFDVTNNLDSNQYYYYNFPASLIKRVEVTKTPDAVLYGSNAFMGIIQVMTLDEENHNQLDGTVTSKDRQMGSLFQTLKVAEGDLNLDLHYSYSHPLIEANPVLIFTIDDRVFSRFREPLLASTKEETYGMGINYKKEAWSIGYRLQSYTKGDFFGILNITPLRDDRSIETKHHAFQVAYDKYLNADLKWHFQWDMKDYRWNGTYRTMPYDLNATDDPDKDVIMGANIHEFETGVISYLKYSDIAHTLRLQLEAHYAKPIDSYYIQYVPILGDTQTDLNLGPNGLPLTGDQNILKEGIDRKNYAIAVEEMYSFNSDLSVIGGMRFDYYTDFNTHLSYKFGAVNNISPKTTVKLLFNHAFRAPSWIELYARSVAEFHGNEALEAETMDMVEANWLYHCSPQDLVKFNLYYGKHQDPIIRTLSPQGETIYDNGETILMRGFEVSYRRIFGAHNEWGASLSHHNGTGSTVSMIENETRKDMVKWYLHYELSPSLVSFTQVEYGSRITVPPPFAPIDAYWLVNQTVSYTYKHWTVRTGVTNLLDEKIDYLTAPTDIVAGAYRFIPDGVRIPSVGREWFISVSASW
ncbi:MAG: hypothetical protein DSY46_05655 [Hydrogenimonas sp.]|nr:MAG: hypothetical protein DSY46_05655 [Hydrogenimonas sp.]